MSNFNQISKKDNESDEESNNTRCSNFSCKNSTSWFGLDEEADEDFEANLFWRYIPALLVISIVIITTVALSFWYVPYNNYALVRSTYTGVELNNVYGEGRYFITLDKQLVYFPSTYKEISFTSKTFAENGLEFDCFITFYYRLPKDKVGAIYDSYSTAYNTRVINNAKQIVKNVASKFSVDNFLNNRTYIETTMAYALEAYLRETVQVEAPNEYFKIVNIIFPKTLIDKSLETAIALQNNQIQLYQQEVNVIEADTNKLKAEIDAKTSRTLEYANNEANKIITNSQSESTRILLLTRSKGIDNVCNAIGITKSSDINRLTNIFAVMDNIYNFTMLNDVKGSLLLQA